MIRSQNGFGLSLPHLLFVLLLLLCPKYMQAFWFSALRIVLSVYYSCDPDIP